MTRLRASRFGGAGPLRAARFGAAIRLACGLAGLLVLAACGKKGPPLEPLRLAPAQPAEPTLVRVGPEIKLQFTLPTANVSGTGAVDIDRVEIYALTVAPGAAIPENKEFLVRKNLIATIPVKPLPVEGEEAAPEPAPAVKDERPSPGERVTFRERLTAAEMTPTVFPKPLVKRDAEAVAVAAATQPPPPDWVFPTRVYIVRGVSRGGHPGAPISRLPLQIADAPPPPAALTAAVTEKAVTLQWTSPPIDVDPVLEATALRTATETAAWLAQGAVTLPAAPTVARAGPILRPQPIAIRVLPGVFLPLSPPTALRFNLYEVIDGKTAEVPLNAAPLPATTFALGKPEWGRERCFAVRTVRRYGRVAIESEEAASSCVTPRDTFAPAAPTGLRLVASPGGMRLLWTPNAEADLAGYVVLRGVAPGETLQALTATPVRETTYEDATVTPGVHYVYAIVAVDTASPPNMSAQSPRQEETAR